MTQEAAQTATNAMLIYDISRPISAKTPPWPGDTPFAIQWGWRLDEGDSVNVASVAMSVHTATHIDAPFHFDQNGLKAGELDLAPFWGPAIVVDVSATVSLDVPIGWDSFSAIDFSRTPRILVKTNLWRDSSVFPAAMPTFALDTVEQFATHGVLLIGIDVPSFDPIDSANLPVHNALGRAGIQLLESLDLTSTPSGEYELSALPLRLAGADGAPVRAALRRL